MKTIKIGSRYEIYDDNIETFDELPAKTYSIRFAKMSGFFLEEHSDLGVREKVYGPHTQKAEKVLRSFNLMDRNLGVILSGDKGIGKSMFGRMLSEMAVAAGYPVLIVDTYYPGISSYLDSIQQEVVVFFDEFDKTVAAIKGGDNEADAQANLLGLFDGLSMGKKLFVITCNDISRLSDYLVNRPGRFHYHFRFDYPSKEEITLYMREHLDEQYYGEIPHVIAFAGKVNLNYDCLRAISFELNLGTSFKDAILDLNIINTNEMLYSMVLQMQDGSKLTNHHCRLNMFDSEETNWWLTDSKGNQVAQIYFCPSDAVYDASTGSYSIEPGMFHLRIDESEEEESVVAVKNTSPLMFYIKKTPGRSLHYAV